MGSKKNRISYVNVTTGPIYTSLFLYPNDDGKNELKSPVNLPNMVCVTAPLYKAVAQYGFNTRSLFHVVANAHTEMTIYGNGDQFLLSNEEQFYPFFLTSGIDAEKPTQMYLLPEFGEVFDVYCEKAHGTVDPFWESYMSHDRMFMLYETVNKYFIKYGREWLWSHGDVVCHVYSNNRKNGTSFYLGCNGVITVHSFKFDEHFRAYRYLPHAFEIPYAQWSDKSSFEIYFDPVNAFDWTANKQINTSIREYTKEVSERVLPRDSIFSNEKGQLLDNATIISKVLTQFIGFDSIDAKLFIKNLIDLSINSNDNVTYDMYLSCFYNIIRTMDPYKRYFMSKDLEYIASRVSEFFPNKITGGLAICEDDVDDNEN